MSRETWVTLREETWVAVFGEYALRLRRLEGKPPYAKTIPEGPWKHLQGP